MIWDNGRGMNFSNLVSWATMGVSTPPTHDDNFKMTQEEQEKYITSDFSRYGVGSKKAIFNLGDEVKLEAKAKDSRWVSEVTLSRSKLEQEFANSNSNEQKWQTVMKTRAPTKAEAASGTFTRVTISNIKELYLKNYDASNVRRELAHLYHYYIFGPKGNNRKPRVIDEPISSNENEDEEMAESVVEENSMNIDEEDDRSRCINITVDGVSVADRPENDMESRYLQNGCSPFHFNMQLSVVTDSNEQITQTQGTQSSPDFSSSQQTQAKKKVHSKVRGVVYYYPFKDGKETLPIPDGVSGGYYHRPRGVVPDDEIPLSERDYGLECFWNARLLSNEKVRSIPFMTRGAKRSSKDIAPDQCYRRVKGMLFLDSNFEVSANKMYLNKQNPLCQSLLSYDDRTLAQRYKKWIEDCHKQLDEEIIFEDVEKTRTSHNHSRTFYNKIKHAQQSYKVGDKVLLKTKTNRVGIIREIYRNSVSDNYLCYITVQHWDPNGSSDQFTQPRPSQAKAINADDDQSRDMMEQDEEDELEKAYPLNKISKVLSASEFKNEIGKVKDKQPSFIGIVDTQNVAIALRRPPIDPVSAGAELKYLSAAIHSGDKKIVKKPYPMKLTIYYERDGAENPVTVLTSDKGHKSGIHCFKLYTLKPPSYTLAGTVCFELTCPELPNIKSKMYKLHVIPGSRANIQRLVDKPSPKKKKKKNSLTQTQEELSDFSKEGPITFAPGEKFDDVRIVFTDAYGNLVRLTDEDANNITISCTSGSFRVSDYSVKRETRKLHYTKTTEDFDCAVISDLVVVSDEEDHGQSCVVTIVAAGMQEPISVNIDCAILSDKIQPPKKLEFEESTAEMIENISGSKALKITNGELPCFKLKAFTASGQPSVYDPRPHQDDDEAERLLVCRADCTLLKDPAYAEALREEGVFMFDDMCKMIIDKENWSDEPQEIQIKFSIDGYPECSTKCKFSIVNQKKRKTSQEKASTQKKKTQEKEKVKNKPICSKARLKLASNQEHIKLENHDDNSVHMTCRIAEKLTGWRLELREEDSAFGNALDGTECLLNWKNDTVAVQRGSVELPDLKLPIVEKENIYTVIIDSFEFKIHIHTVFGPPAAFQLVKREIPVKCGVPFSFVLNVVDAESNPLSPSTHENIYPELKSVKPCFEIDKKSKNLAKIDTSAKHSVRWSASRGVIRVSGIVVLGKSEETINLVIRDESGTVKAEKLALKVDTGNPHHIRVNGVDSVKYTVTNFSQTPKLSATLHDLYDNLITKDSGWGFELTCDDGLEFGNSETDAMEEIEGDGGSFILPPMWVSVAEDGLNKDYQITIGVKPHSEYPSLPKPAVVDDDVQDMTLSQSVASQKKTTNIEPVIITLHLVPSKNPKRFVVKCNALEIPDSNGIETVRCQCKAGTNLDKFEVQVIGEDGKPARAPSQLMMELIPQPDNRKSMLVTRTLLATPPIDDEDLTYTFTLDKQLVELLQQTGIYQYIFKCDLSEVPYFASVRQREEVPVKRETNTVELSQMIEVLVRADKASKLELEQQDYIIPLLSNKGNISQRSFWEKMKVVCTDKFGNPVQKVNSLEISLEVEAEKSMEVPELDGVTTAKYKDGGATFGRISIAEGCNASCGTFKLHIKSNISAIKDKELPFMFSDSQKVQEEERKIQEQIKKIGQKIAQHEIVVKEIQSLEGDRSRRLDQCRQTLEFEIRSMMKLNGDDATDQDVSLLEESSSVKRMLKEVETEIDEMKKSESKQPKYAKDYGYAKNNSLQFVQKSLERDGKLSGIIGCIGHMGFAVNEDCDVAISNCLFEKIQTVICKDSNSAHKLREDLSSGLSKSSFQSIPILSLDNFVSTVKIDPKTCLVKGEVEPGQEKGFLGYACNLLDIGAQDSESLLVTWRKCLFNILGYYMVFDTMENGYAFRQRRVQDKKPCPLIVTAKGERIEPNGIMYAGQQRTSSYRFGVMPLEEQHRFVLANQKRDLLQKIQKLIQQRDDTEKNLEEERERDNSSAQTEKQAIEKLKAEQEKLKQKIANLMQDMTIQVNGESSTPKKKGSQKRQREPPKSPELFQDDDDDDDEMDEEEEERARKKRKKSSKKR